MSFLEIKSIPRPSYGGPSDVDPLLYGNVENWPHLNELSLCLTADYVHVENKYGHFENVLPPDFVSQEFEINEFPGQDVASSSNGGSRDRSFRLELEKYEYSGKNPIQQIIGNGNGDEFNGGEDSNQFPHFGFSPLAAYDPVFNWTQERGSVTGQRLQVPPNISSSSGIRFSVRILSMSVQAGLFEPIYGSICLYHSDRKERLSEDFYFQFLPPDWPGESTSPDARAIFSVDSQNSNVLLLVQLEKPATDESISGVKSNIYCRKDNTAMSEREADRLHEWAKVMPFRESFSWITIPLFDSNATGGVGGFGTPNDSNTPQTPGSPFSVASNLSDDFKMSYDFGGPPVLVDIPHVNRAKEGYSEEELLDPKRKLHKPVKASMRFEIERLPQDEAIFQSSLLYSLPTGIRTPHSPITPRTPLGNHRRESSLDLAQDGYEYLTDDIGSQIGSLSLSRITGYDGFRALDFQSLVRNEPFSRLLHCLFVYPQSVSLGKKYNLLIRVELRNNDADIQMPAMEAICPREGNVMLRNAFTQVVSSTKSAHYHDEVKIRMPALLNTNLHLLFTFFHIDLFMKNEPPKPVPVGYAVLPITAAIQTMKNDFSLPVSKDLFPHYLQENVRRRLNYWDEGKLCFKVRTRICSSIFPLNEKVREFFHEYDRHCKEISLPGSELIDSTNSLKGVDFTTLVQYLYPVLNMLLCMIGNGVETLQVAAFRAMINIVSRIQSEFTESERNKYLVHYIDYIFDDISHQQTPVYPGLCNVWLSLAKSVKKGYRVGPVYDEALYMSWFVLELMVKSMDLELSQVPQGGEIARLRVEDEVYQCIWQLFDFLLSEIQERAKKGLSLAKKLNCSIAFFCYDLLSVIDPPQVFELVGVYLTKFAGMCHPVLHRYKLTFLRIICDHDFYVETPGRVPIEKNYLTTVLLKELFISLDHEDQSQKTKAARILAFLITKHEYDSRYQQPELKLYISQLYFPIVSMILDEVSVFNNLSASEKRDILICILTMVRNLDEESLWKSWKISSSRTKLFFQLLEESISLFEFKKGSTQSSLQSFNSYTSLNSFNGSMSFIEDDSMKSDSMSTKFSDKLSPSTNGFLSDAAHDDKHPLDKDYTSTKKHSNPHRMSMKETVSNTFTNRKDVNRMMRESLPTPLKYKLDLWEGNLCTGVSLQVLEILESYSDAAYSRAILTDYDRMESMALILNSFLSRPQSLAFWKVFPSSFSHMLRQHGEALLGRIKDKYLKDFFFHLMGRMLYRNDYVRKRAVVCMQLLIRASLQFFDNSRRLKPVLIITLSELVADMKVLHKGRSGIVQETPELFRLRKSLHEIGSEETSPFLIRECLLPENTLDAVLQDGSANRWRWKEVQEIRLSLLRVLEANVEHSRLLEEGVNPGDNCSMVESYHSLARAYSYVPDLHIVWLLHLCETHQESQLWAEAAQCAIAVAGVIMKALMGTKMSVWKKEHLDALRKLCPILNLNADLDDPASGSENENFAATNLTVDSAVKYLQMGNSFFKQAELYHFCAEILEIIIPVHKGRQAYGQLSKCHTMITDVYQAIARQESNPIPFKDATYYRVGFYGNQFGSMNRKEYIYREARDIRLGDIKDKLAKLYESKPGEETLQIFPGSGQVDAIALDPMKRYMQITAVEPVVGHDEAVWMNLHPSSKSEGAPCYDRFVFDTPFTPGGKAQGGLEDQWKRRTILYTEGSFPSLINRLVVVKSEVREYTPVENSIIIIESRSQALEEELQTLGVMEAGGNSLELQMPRIQTLQRLLQGSVALQVNSGVLGVCIAFLKPVESESQPAKKEESVDDNDILELVNAIMEFVEICKRAINAHAYAMGEDDREFHSQLAEGLEILIMEIGKFIPGLK